MPLRVVLGIALLVLGGARIAGAQSAVQVDAQVDAYTIGTAERLTYSLRIQGAALEAIRTPEPPPTSNLVLLNATPMTEQFARQRNGRTERVVTFAWRYRPMRTGTATLDPLSVRVGGQTISTARIEVDVVPQSARAGAAPSGSPHGTRARRRSGSRSASPDAPLIGSDDLFIDVTPADTAAFVGEQVPIEYRLYFRPGIRLRQSRLAEAWEAPGFWREELEIAGQPRPDDPDAAYRYIVIKRVAAFPTRAGSLRVRPLRVETEATPGLGMVSARQLRPGQRAFEAMQLASPPVQVQARPVPTAPAPDAFRGAVGALEWERSAVAREVAVGEGLTVSVSVRGTGNLYAIEAPPLSVPDHVEVVGPNTETDIDRTGRVLRGKRTFTYTLVPRAAEPFTVPALSWSHFDPRTESFVMHTSDAVSVQVQPQAPGQPVAEQPPAPAAQRGWMRWAAGLGSAIGLGALALWGYWTWGAAWGRRRSVRDAERASAASSVQEDAMPERPDAGAAPDKNVAPARDAEAADASAAALTHAQAHLERAQQALRTDTADAFYRAVDQAVVALVAGHLQRAPNGLTRQALFDALRHEGVDAEVRASVRDLLHACDEARFSPATPAYDALRATLDTTHTLMQHLDRALSGRQ